MVDRGGSGNTCVVVPTTKAVAARASPFLSSPFFSIRGCVEGGGKQRKGISMLLWRREEEEGSVSVVKEGREGEGGVYLGI